MADDKSPLSPRSEEEVDDASSTDEDCCFQFSCSSFVSKEDFFQFSGSTFFHFFSSHVFKYGFKCVLVMLLFQN